MAFCSKCGARADGQERFCISCGAELAPAPVPEQQKKEAVKEGKYTPGGKKIIDAGPKPQDGGMGRRGAARKSTIRQTSAKKKEGSGGSFLRVLFFLASIVLGGALIIYVVNVFIVEDDVHTATNIPGIINIDTIDVSHYTGSKRTGAAPAPSSSSPSSSSTIAETSDIKSAATTLETVFEKADTTALKSMLTETSSQKYAGVYKEIQPYMEEYAKAFKNRKLARSSSVYALYKFNDEQGNVFSVEFASFGDGKWKLVRF